MEGFCVYILYSRSIDRFYIGYTGNMDSRLEQHNKHVFKGSFTDKAEDWELYHSIPNLSEKTAKLIEKHIKKNKSRTYLRNLKEYPELSKNLILKYL
ncbi:GIY-YIG nuclease family protein [Aquiflexum lacus]|uniref:GIY-YIG nuclease family protein n=1 Tax=Aquiflexum lacus TaxID=2483805 RepID=UPI00189399FA|nr:GIY-YIG nuclease family protein [Aquiflexum lacus]